MDRSKLIERLMATFLEELSEHVRAINDDLLALEKGPAGPEQAERYKTLFRSAHSLKGAARSVGVGMIEDACHRLEEVLSSVRDGRMTLDAGLYALLFATADAIEEAGMRLRERHDLAGSPLEALIPRLDLASAGVIEPPPAPRETHRESIGDPGPHPDPLPEGEGTGILPPLPPGEGRGEGAPESKTTKAIVPTPAVVPSFSSFVRVPAERLDAMLTRNGELLVARRGVESWSDEVAGLRDFVGRWRDEWRAATRPLGKLRRRAEGEAEADPLVRRLGQALDRAGDRLNDLEDQLDRLAGKMARNRRQLARAADLLDEDVRRVRMLPFADACQGLERAARDLSQAAGKPVELVIEGGAVELDRSVLEGLKDPLMHLVRNAIDHGIEPANRRRAADKPMVARVSVTAALRGSQVEIVVADDGAGLDFDALRRQASARGLSESADDRALADLIFQPGFSTSAIITNISGRGVGLDVVKSRVEALHGTIDLASEPGRGMRFTLAVPLTLTTLRALLVKASGQLFAVAGACVQRLLRIDPRDLRMVEGREMLLTRGSSPLPVASLSASLGLVASPEPAGADDKRPGLIVAVGDRRAAFIVDELLAEQEVVVKGLGGRVRRVRLVSGSTILPSGRIALVLNTVNLLRAALSQGSGPAASRARDRPSAGAAVASRKRLLVVDDSVTTRTLAKTILEAAGYEVATAVDGEDGWRLLQERGADLLISDIEMPRMDGFALAGAVRASTRFAELPVILFSSRASEADKARGIEVGADAYIVKGAFDQKDLLETIAQLL